MENLIKKHISDNIKGYIFVVLFFVIGVIVGASLVNGYPEKTGEYMKEFFLSSKNIYSSSEPDLTGVFKAAMRNSLKNSVLVWGLGFTVIGAPVILLVILKCGFVSGFLCGFLFRIFSYKGLAAAGVIIFPQCLLYLPAMFFISCVSVKFSVTLLKMITGKTKYKVNLRYYILRYVFYGFSVSVIMIVYSLAEAYIGANILKLILT